MKYIITIITLLLISCGYPDIDSVPDFKDVFLSDQEIKDYCTNNNIDMKNIDKCINDYKSKK